MKNIIYAFICFFMVGFNNFEKTNQENVLGKYYALKNYYEFCLELQDENYFVYYEGDFSHWKQNGAFSSGKWILKNDTLILNSQEPAEELDTSEITWLNFKEKLYKVQKGKLIEIGFNKRKLKKEKCTTKVVA